MEGNESIIVQTSSGNIVISQKSHPINSDHNSVTVSFPNSPTHRDDKIELNVYNSNYNNHEYITS